MKKFLRTLIHTLPTNTDTELQFAINQYEDRYYVDVRVWTRIPQAKGFRPSQKGISLPLHRLSALREGVEILERSLSERGLKADAAARNPSMEKTSFGTQPKPD